MKFIKLIVATVVSVGAVNIVFQGGYYALAILSGRWAAIDWTIMLAVSFYVSIVTAAIVVVFGIPIYLLLEHVGNATRFKLVKVGFVVPVFVFGIINLYLNLGDTSSYSRSYYGATRQMVVDGQRTLWGWVEMLEQGFVFCICGAVAAFMFGLAMQQMEVSR